MSDNGSTLSLTLKVLIGSAIGVCVGFGTCGAGAVLSNGSEIPKQIFVPLGLIIFGVSLVAFIVSALWLLVESLVNIFRR